MVVPSQHARQEADGVAACRANDEQGNVAGEERAPPGIEDAAVIPTADTASADLTTIGVAPSPPAAHPSLPVEPPKMEAPPLEASAHEGADGGKSPPKTIDGCTTAATTARESDAQGLAPAETETDHHDDDDGVATMAIASVEVTSTTSTLVVPAAPAVQVAMAAQTTATSATVSQPPADASMDVLSFTSGGLFD